MRACVRPFYKYCLVDRDARGIDVRAKWIQPAEWIIKGLAQSFYRVISNCWRIYIDYKIAQLRLLENVYLVGGGPVAGLGLTTGGDCHVYLVDGGSELALIDCGLGTSFETVIGHIKDDGFDPGRIKRLFLTHYHGDHAGGAAKFHDELGVEVAIASEARAALETGDEEATSLAAARAAGIYPADYRLQGCAVADALEDGETRQVGTVNIRFLSTPGHCRGHGSYLMTGSGRPVLFAGDAVFWTGQILLQAIPDCDLQAALGSVLKLEQLDFETLLPGHGAFTLSGAHQHVEMAAKTIRSLGIPRNLV
jgi:glyoxylase-like metal-dependent hydrolase (beta-lactamase superfamily II)